MTPKNEIRSDLSLVDAVTGNLFAGLHDLRSELAQAIGHTVVAGETVTRACFAAARIALTRFDSVAAALIAEGERASISVVSLLRRARREVPGGVVDMASAITGGTNREIIAPRPSA